MTKEGQKGTAVCADLASRGIRGGRRIKTFRLCWETLGRPKMGNGEAGGIGQGVEKTKNEGLTLDGKK